MITNPTDPKLDRWLRKQPPKTELALRYAIRGRFFLSGNRRLNARIDELFASLRPSEDEYAAILRHAREIGAAMNGYFEEPAATDSGGKRHGRQ